MRAHTSHWLSLEINVGVIHSAGPDHIKMDGPPGGACVRACRVPSVCVFSTARSCDLAAVLSAIG